jgi:hypothetical protein
VVLPAEAPRAALAFSLRLTPRIDSPQDSPEAAPSEKQTTPAKPPPTSEPLPAANVDRRAGPAEPERDTTPARAPTEAASAAAAAGHTGGLVPAMETHSRTAAVSAQIVDDHGGSLFHSRADAIRSAEPVPPAPVAQRTGATQGISVRIAPPEMLAVNLQVTQRAGQVQVAVHTSNPALQSSLRRDLGTLVDSLEGAGYHAETFAPREAAVSKTPPAEMNSPNDRSQAHPDFSGHSSGQGSRDSSEHRPPPHPRERRTREWLTEWEKQP